MTTKLPTATGEAQRLINTLVYAAASLNSPYPMKALQAFKQVEKLKNELHQYIANQSK